jgi:hypothetical protein
VAYPARYFAPRYFAPRYFATRRPVAPVAPVALLPPGVVLSFPARPRIFRVVARGGLIVGGAAQAIKTDRWARARAEDELWLLLL